MWERQVTQVLIDRWFAVPPVCPTEEVLDDLEAALTRIDSSGTDDEPLVRPCRAKEVTTEGSQGGGRLRRLRVVSSSSQDVGSTVLETASSDIRGSESPIASTVQASSRAIRARYGSPQVTSTVPDSRSTVGVERGQRDRPQGQASSGIARRFEVLAEEDGEEGVDHPDFFGGESDTESLADPQHDEADPPVPAIPVNPVRRVVGAFAQLDVVDLFERRTRIMRTVPYVMRGAHREAMRVALDHISSGRSRSETLQEERGWKLFLLIPRLLLFRPGREASFRSENWRREPTDSQQDSGCHCLQRATKSPVMDQQVPHAGEDATQVTIRRHCPQNDWRLCRDCTRHSCDIGQVDESRRPARPREVVPPNLMRL